MINKEIYKIHEIKRRIRKNKTPKVFAFGACLCNFKNSFEVCYLPFQSYEKIFTVTVLICSKSFRGKTSHFHFLKYDYALLLLFLK